MNPNKSRAVFLDRDGVLNKPLIRDGRPLPPDGVETLELLDGVAEGCKALKAAGFVLVVVTNQPDVGRRTKPESEVEEIHRRLSALLPQIDKIEVCYDKADGISNRRKPEPGMLLDAAQELNIHLTDSWMVGDRNKDIACGRRAGCKTILIGDGYKEPSDSCPDFTCKDFLAATREILSETIPGQIPEISTTLL